MRSGYGRAVEIGEVDFNKETAEDELSTGALLGLAMSIVEADKSRPRDKVRDQYRGIERIEKRLAKIESWADEDRDFKWMLDTLVSKDDDRLDGDFFDDAADYIAVQRRLIEKDAIIEGLEVLARQDRVAVLVRNGFQKYRIHVSASERSIFVTTLSSIFEVLGIHAQAQSVAKNLLRKT